MKTNAALLILVTQAVDLLARHPSSRDLEDKETMTQMRVLFRGQACRKAAANASPDELSKLVRSAVNILKKNESPLTYHDHDAVRALHSIFDGRRCRKALRVIPQKRSTLYDALRDCAATTKLSGADIAAAIGDLRMTLFLRQPPKRLRYEPEENFRTLLKAIRECPTPTQERERLKLEAKRASAN